MFIFLILVINQIQNILLLQILIKRNILVLLVMMISQFIKMKKKTSIHKETSKNEDWNNPNTAGHWSSHTHARTRAHTVSQCHTHARTHTRTHARMLRLTACEPLLNALTAGATGCGLSKFDPTRSPFGDARTGRLGPAT